jgi:hypothetical protein
VSIQTLELQLSMAHDNLNAAAVANSRQETDTSRSPGSQSKGTRSQAVGSGGEAVGPGLHAVGPVRQTGAALVRSGGGEGVGVGKKAGGDAVLLARIAQLQQQVRLLSSSRQDWGHVSALRPKVSRGAALQIYIALTDCIFSPCIVDLGGKTHPNDLKLSGCVLGGR